MAPRPVVLAGVLSGEGKPLPVAEVEAEYGKGGHLRILPSADWSGAGILAQLSSLSRTEARTSVPPGLRAGRAPSTLRRQP